MRNTCFIALVLIWMWSCIPEPETKHLTYQNIIILSDMSSRLTNMEPKDIPEINNILKYFKEECVKPGEKIGDRSKISYAALSEAIAAKIDLDDIQSLGEKQRFVNSTGEFIDSGLEAKLTDFKKQVREVYKNIRNPGLDLISVLMERIENGTVIRTDETSIIGLDTLHTSFDNHIYLFTDGYLEYRNKRTNSQFYFGLPEMEKIRKYCRENDVTVQEALSLNQELGLPAYPGKYNNLIHLHILETHERDKDIRLQTYRNPLGLRDNEILEAVWRKWAVDSGFKSFEWRKY